MVVYLAILFGLGAALNSTINVWTSSFYAVSRALQGILYVASP